MEDDVADCGDGLVDGVLELRPARPVPEGRQGEAPELRQVAVPGLKKPWYLKTSKRTGLIDSKLLRRQVDNN